MLNIAKRIPEQSGLEIDRLPQDVLESEQPLVLKNLVSHWPLVKAAKESGNQAMDYLRSFYLDATVGAFFGHPGTDGRVFYNEDMTGFNYQPMLVKLDVVLDKLREHADDQATPAIYVGSTTVDTCLPGLRTDNDLDLKPYQPLASIWLGNRSRIAAHHDLPDNVACNAAGRRRFTLFPPDEIDNLYVGPIDFNPAGQAISLVDFKNPDLSRFPKFELAMENALVADLEPGDAIFIPSMWWHHVEAKDWFNVLINYWWRRSPAFMGPPIDVLMHALLTIRDLPAGQRNAWQKLFDHYVFNASEASFAHIPESRRGVLAPMDERTARRVRAELLNRLNR